MTEELINDENLKEFLAYQGSQKWYDTRPKCIQEAIRKYPPYLLYRLKTTGQIVYIHCYNSDDADVKFIDVNVQVSKRFNRALCNRIVGYINPEDLEPLAHQRDCSKYTIQWSPEHHQIAQEFDAKIQQNLEKWHREIPSTATPDERRVAIFEKIKTLMSAFLLIAMLLSFPAQAQTPPLKIVGLTKITKTPKKNWWNRRHKQYHYQLEQKPGSPVELTTYRKIADAPDLRPYKEQHPWKSDEAWHDRWDGACEFGNKSSGLFSVGGSMCGAATSAGIYSRLH